MSRREAQLIWECAQSVNEMWDTTSDKKKKAYTVGFRQGQSGEPMGETSDTWGPAVDAFEQGYRAGAEAAQPKTRGILKLEYGLEIVEGRDRDLDEPGERYGPDTFELRAVTPQAKSNYGDGVLSTVYARDVEHMSMEELEQVVIQSINKHGKPSLSLPG